MPQALTQAFYFGLGLRFVDMLQPSVGAGHRKAPSG
jgi:hypothetical protein